MEIFLDYIHIDYNDKKLITIVIRLPDVGALNIHNRQLGNRARSESIYNTTGSGEATGGHEAPPIAACACARNIKHCWR